MNLQYLGFVPTIIIIVYLTNIFSGGDIEKWEKIFVILGYLAFSTLIVFGLAWALS